jgi:uncharacterized RDD family membrane protein YckC
MKCPKCSYTSFDYLESCKKCGKDLTEFKQRFGITSVLFPGQLQAEEAVAETEYDEATADAAVAAATGVAAGAATGGMAEESDDFGFDFMGDSTEEDDLSFDELFEEAPEDEDVEETIEGPQEKAATEDPQDEAKDFSFDLPEEDEGLADDFGFDPTDEEDEDSVFRDDEDSGPDEDQGTEEDPKSPFDLPESPAVGEAPEPEHISFSAGTAVAPAGVGTELSAAAEEAYPESEAIPGDAPDRAADEAADAFVAADPEPFAEQQSAVFSGPVAERAEPELREDIGAPVIPYSLPSTLNRLGAFLCDLVVLVLVGLSFIIAAEAAITTGDQRWLPSLTTLIDLSIPYFLVLFSLAFGYFTLFHFLAGQTPGKMLAGLRVESTSGEALSFAEAFLRSVGGLIQMLPLGLGHLSILLYADRRGWNDRLAATRVVKAER